jgi:hypothetical protein
MPTCPDGYAVGPSGDCIQTPEFRLQGVLQQYLTAAQLGQYGDPPPTQEQMEAMLAQEAQNICKQSFIPCASTPSSLVASAGDQYATFLDRVVPDATLTAPVVNLPGGGQSYYNPVYAQNGPFYNPSAGFVTAPNSMPPELSPTSPAFTSPTNTQSTGSTTPGTASGSGSTQGGSGSVQSTLIPSAADASMAGLLGKGDSKLLMILLGVAILVIIFGRN